MTGWLTSLRDRPIAEHERRSAMAAVVVLLCATTVLLALTQPGRQHLRPTRQTSPIPAAPASAVRRRASENTSTPLAPPAARAASLFLAGYLAYIYGHVPASKVNGATPALIGSLRSHPPRVSPEMRTRQAHVLALHAAAAPSGLVGVSALVNDGGLVDYQVRLLLTSQDGRLLVSGLEPE